MNKLANRLALITGGGRGIGRAVAFAFAREGASVAVVARTIAEVRRVAEEIKAECVAGTFAASCDVSERASVEHAFAETVAHFGRGPDILVNNAGVAESAP